MDNFLKKEIFSTGIEDIDQQHQALYDTIQIFNCDENSQETLWSILLDVERYCILHFDTEEKYMEKFNYPFVEEHIAEHRDFVEKFSALKKDFTEEGFSKEFINGFRTFLTTWLQKHYADTDITLADFLNERLSTIANDKN